MALRIVVVITTLDNLPTLKEQIRILSRDPLISEIIVVNNGSQDGTREWLDGNQPEIVTSIHRENLGAGPGRNAGIEAAGEFDYIHFLDGGIRALINGVKVMLEYLERHPEVDVISPEIATCFTTDPEVAHRRISGIDDESCFPQRMLSGTAYCLCRARAFDGLRFSEEGPFAEPGWGVDDNEMAYQWEDAGIVHHDFQYTSEGKHPLLYRRASGSFRRLFQETGVWANQYGSVYEKRNVLCAQLHPRWHDPIWRVTNMQVSVVMTVWNEYPMFVHAIKRFHEDLWEIPHEIIVVNNGSTDRTKWWLDTFALRWHHLNDTTIDADTGEILRRRDRPDLEDIWTGNVIAINFDENMGTAVGGNAAFDRAAGKYIFLTDGDILPVRGSVKAMYEYMENHPEHMYCAVNAHMCQDKDPDPPAVETFEGYPRWGMGNYAYGYSLFRRELLDEGIRYPETGPFKGPGCGYTDADFAYQMYQKKHHGFFWSFPGYYHKRRDLDRTGHEEGKAERNLDERRSWLYTKWPDLNLEMVHYHDGPPDVHVRKVAVVGKGLDMVGDLSHSVAAALEKICHIDRFRPEDVPTEGDWDNYLYVDCGDGSPMESVRHPSIFWISDMVFPHQYPHSPPERYLAAAQTHDWVYAAQPSAVAWLREQGVDARWLPLAANPDVHKPYKAKKELKWIALWHNCGERIKLIEYLSKEIPGGWVSWQNEDKYARQMSRARCSLNLARVGETNLRVFETMAIGVPLITSRGTEGIDELFVEGEHYLA
jgi:glycosyltransferase involved in cell wall biosynthesis